jgi:hypothetical protein
MKIKISLALLSVVVYSCVQSSYKVNSSDNRVWLLKDNSIVDSIALFKENYLEYKLIGSTLYYSDNLNTPGRVNLNLYKVQIKGKEFGDVQRQSLGSFDNDYWIIKEIRITNKIVTLRIAEIEKKTITTKRFSLDSLFSK